MKVALIPPKGMESYALHSKFHLALALPELLKNPAYVTVYQRAARAGDYIVLDHGEAEGSQVSHEALIAAAELLEVTEIILPDVLRRTEDTLYRVQTFLGEHLSRIAQYKLMAVTQGITLTQFRMCVNRYAEVPNIRVIGIPRLMIATLNNPSARVDFANWIAEKHPDRFEIHLLGCDSNHPKEVRWAAKYASHVRSIDSSMPFNYALRSTMLTNGQVGITRPDDYLTRSWQGKVNNVFVKSNIDTFMGWAVNGEEASVSGVREVSLSRERTTRPFASPYNP